MQNFTKKTLLVCLLIVVISGLAVADEKGRGNVLREVTIKTATSFKEGHILSDFLYKFKQIIESMTANKITVEIEAGINTEEEVNIMCSEGTIDLQSTGGFPLQDFAPEYFFFNAPYVIKDYDHFLRVWNGPIGKEAKDIVLENGNMLCVGTVFRGLRQMTSNVPIAGTEDIVGLKLRLPGVPTWIAVWEELEADVVAVPLTGLYDALDSGLAEASEGDLTQIYSFNLFEVQSQLTITNHLVAVGWITLNDEFFRKLPTLYQGLILTAIYEASEWATEKIQNNETALLAELQANGMTIGYADAEAIRIKAKPAVEALFASEWPVTTWEEVLAQ